MANINVTYTENTITVDEVTSNVTVASTTNNITVSSASVASNADIRAAISNTAPITYNSTTGVIGIDSGAVFSGKTTDDLAEGTTNLYFTNSRVAAYLTSNFTTTDIPEGANLYYTVDRANAAFNNIVTSNVVVFAKTPLFNQGMRVAPSYDLGNVSGSLTISMANGAAQELRLIGNTSISFPDLLNGQTAYIVATQDGTGGRTLTIAGDAFLNGDNTINPAALSKSLITVTKTGVTDRIYVTINDGITSSLTNAQVVSYIANNSLTVGGNLTVNNNASIGANLTVTNNAIIRGNNITVANILIPGSEHLSNFQPGANNVGRIAIPVAGNLFIGSGSGGGYDSRSAAIDVTGDIYQPILIGKPIDSAWGAVFGRSGSAPGFNSDIVNIYGNIASINGNISGTYILGNGSQLTGIASNAGVVSYIATQPLTVGGNLTVNGNINATGNINYQNVTDLYVTDQKITLNSNAATNANVEVIAYRPEATDTLLKWNEQSDIWEFTNDGTTYYPIPTSTSDLAEGTNLYYTTDRANTAIANYTSNNGLSLGGNLDLTNYALQSSTGPTLIKSTANYDIEILPSGSGDIILTPDTGDIALNGMIWPTADGANSQVLTTNGAGVLSWTTVSGGAGTYGDANVADFLANSFGSNTITTTGNITASSFVGTATKASQVTITSNGGAADWPIVFTSAAGTGKDLYIDSGSTNFTWNPSTNQLKLTSIQASGSINTGSTISASGNVTGNFFVGNGRVLTGILTSNVTEETNLYYTTDRANTAIADKLIDSTQKLVFNAAVQDLYLTPNASSPSGGYYMPNVPGSVGDVLQLTGGDQAEWQRLDTGDVDEGANLYYTTARANSAIDDYVVGSENINVSSGVISLTNALGNVNAISSSADTNLTLNSDDKLVLTQNFKGREVGFSGNVTHEGYAFFASNAYTGNVVASYTGNANIQNFIFATGNTTAGSNAITDVSLVEFVDAATPANISDVVPNMVLSVNENNPYPFPYGTVVTSVDAANSTIYMSQSASFTQDLVIDILAFFLQPVLLDTETGQALAVYSDFDFNGAPGSKTTLASSLPLFPGRYGYPQSGFAVSDFDVITAGSAGDYTLGNVSSLMMGRHRLAAPTTVLQAPRGMVVGSADLTNRAENDTIGSFGLNVLWDGTDTSYPNLPSGPLTQILVKNYTDNNLQGTNRTNFGPRLMFVAAEGNSNEPYTVTYPRESLELGRISWWSTSSQNPGLSTGAPPAWINGVTGQDCVNTNSGLGMYFANSPDVNNFNRGLYLANTKGNTLISGGPFANSKITFAKMYTDNSGNSVSMYNSTMSGTIFADIGHANTSVGSGSKVTVTNGPTTGAGTVGDMVLTLDRVDNSGNTIVTNNLTINNFFAQGQFGNSGDVFRFAASVSQLSDGQAVTINNYTGSVGSFYNGNVYYVKDFSSNIGQPAKRFWEIYSDSALTTPVDSNIGTGNYGSSGSFEFTVSSGVTDKTWDISLEEQSNDLKFKANGSTVATITDSGNINLATNATINYDAVYGCFHNMSNVTAANADTVYEFAWPNVHIDTNRVTVASNTQITIGQEGAYNFSLEMQTENTDNQDRTAYLWLAKNGTDIDETCVRVTLLKEWKQVIVKEWIVNGINANDYIEVRFAVDNTSGIQLTAIPAQASPYARPAVPSAVITVTPVGV